MDDDLIIESILNNRESIKDNIKYEINTSLVIKTSVLFEDIIYPKNNETKKEIKVLLNKFKENISNILNGVIDDTTITTKIIEAIPELVSKLDKDLMFIFNNDPAAQTKTEIILSYPGFKAIIGYRFANLLHNFNIPIIPRIISEYYHSITGIDIHPGATIGVPFSIDHGTGIVIGETTIIKENVRLYHGVTLGAKNFEKDENGNLVKNKKRHPNIGSNVTIYANATILGKDTYIKDNTVVGVNSLITSSN